MIRGLVLLVWGATACTRSAAPVAPPSTPAISNAPAPVAAPTVAPRCADSLGWLGRTVHLRYTEIANGHFGFSELHADFYRPFNGDTFEGVVTMTYRERPDSVPRVVTRTLTLKHSEVTQLLTSVRDGILTRPRPAEQGVLMVDSSQSSMIAIEAIGSDANGPDPYVQLYTDNGSTSPQTWHIRGCASDPPLDARRAVQDAVDAFALRLDRDATLQRLTTP